MHLGVLHLTNEGGKANIVVLRLARVRRAILQANVLGLTREEACGLDEIRDGNTHGTPLAQAAWKEQRGH